MDCITCKSNLGIEWKISEDRSMLARNWDKWLYWWNQKKVKEYFGIGNKHPLYFLLVTYWNINKGEEKGDFDFDSFRNKFIKGSVSAKNNFEGLRKLQKTFEDFYKEPKIYNFLGLILKTSNKVEDALHYFLNNQSSDFQNYAKWSIVTATHLEIISEIKEKIPETDNTEILVRERKAFEAIDLVNQKNVFTDENGNDYKDQRKEFAYRFLTLLNILEDNKLDRKFDFSIFKERSLEHIYPQCKSSDLDFSDMELQEGSIHCIGNLVMLYKNNNSKFGPKTPQQKKELYFDTGNDFDFRSRNLLHSLSVFAFTHWTEKEIIANKLSTIKKLKDYYGLKL